MDRFRLERQGGRRGVQLDNDEPLFQAPAKAPFTAQIDGDGKITGGVLQVPDFVTHIEHPISADVTVDFDIGEIEGTFDAATGALSLSGTAGGTLTAAGKGTCTVVVPGTLTLTTDGANDEGPSALLGAPFLDGLAKAGAIAGTWENMTAEPVSEPATGPEEAFCEDVEEHSIGGPGGIWLEHDGDLVPPAAPQLTGTSPSSPNASGSPRIRGAAEAGSKVSIYAGPNCDGLPIAAGSAAELASPGIAVGVGERMTATFSATATDAAGNVSPCSAPISYQRVTPDEPRPPVVRTCVVPKLVGKTLKQAKKALKAANCKLGKVTKPKPPKGKKGKKKPAPALVVKKSTPRRGAIPANRKVDLKLGPKPAKKKPQPRKKRG